MDFWQKIIFPVRRVWLSLSARIKSRKNGAGLLKLHDDIETCGYQDVKVMWEMVQKSETQSRPKTHHFWRVMLWSNHSDSATSKLSF